MSDPKHVEQARVIHDWMTTPNTDDAHRNMPDSVFYSAYSLALYVLKQHQDRQEFGYDD